MNAKEFGAYLRELRKNKKLTLDELGGVLGLSKGYLSKIENGQRGIPSPDILKKLYKPLGTIYGNMMKAAGYLDDGSLLINGKLTPPNQILGKIQQMNDAISEHNERLEGVTDIKSLLERKTPHRATFNGHTLTDDERRRILIILETVFQTWLEKGDEQHGNHEG